MITLKRYSNIQIAIGLIGFFAGIPNSAFCQNAPRTNTIEISTQSIPYSGEPGTFEQIYTIPLPYGKLIIHTNLDNGTISYAATPSDGKTHVLLFSKAINSPSGFSFYGQDISKTIESAKIYQDGSTYYAPIEAGFGGNCNSGNDVYIVKWASGSAPVISPIAAFDSADCLRGDFVRPSNSGLTISISNADDLEIESWQYDGVKNSLTRTSPEYYSAQAGFVPLVSSEMPVVKNVVTRYGNLQLNSSSGISLNGIAQSFPADSASEYSGFASKGFQNGNKDEVIGMLTPDNATGIVFQMISISPNNIDLSQYFGSGFSYVSYQTNDQNILLNVGDYAPQAPGFSDQHFQFKNGALAALDARSRIVPSANLPIDITIVPRN